jgi:hypothetical protein
LAQYLHAGAQAGHVGDIRGGDLHDVGAGAAGDGQLGRPLTRNWPVDHGIAREALLATAAFRGTTLAVLSCAVDNLADLRQQAYAAYRANLGTAGEDLPANFSEVVEAVIAFADVLASEASAGTTWSPQQRRWTRKDL